MKGRDILVGWMLPSCPGRVANSITINCDVDSIKVMTLTTVNDNDCRGGGSLMTEDVAKDTMLGAAKYAQIITISDNINDDDSEYVSNTWKMTERE